MISIDRDGEILAECTDCGTEEYGGTLDFAGFVEELKSLGWRIRKDGDEWAHTCPSCVEDDR